MYFPTRDIYSQRRTTKMTIAFCWVFPILLLVLPLSRAWGHFGKECGTRDCIIIREGSGKNYYTFLTLTGFILPIITLIAANIAIFMRVKVGNNRSIIVLVQVIC